MAHLFDVPNHLMGWSFPEKTLCLVIFMLKIHEKDAVKPFKVIYVIYDSLGIVTVQNCAKITSKLKVSLYILVWHIETVLHVSMQLSSAQEKS